MASSRVILDNIGQRLFVGFTGTLFEQNLRDLMEAVRPGGIVLFKRNIAGIDQVANLVEEAQNHALKKLGRRVWVAVDQEGGSVQRLGELFPPLPSAAELAATGTDALQRTVLTAARQLHRLGIHINFAPVLDLATKPGVDFLKDRVMSSDPQIVARLGRLWIDTLQSHSISATAKHFPGLGLASLDPHHHLPTLPRLELADYEPHLVPFMEAVRGNVHAMMSSHAIYPFFDELWPATLSPNIGRDLLRGKFGFEGVLFTDDLDMEAIAGRFSLEDIVRQASASSSDVFLLCQHPEDIEPFHATLVRHVMETSEGRALHHEASERLKHVLGHHLVAPTGS